MYKFPRTRHIQGSKFQHGDHDLSAVPFSELEGKHLVVEEKVDGAQCGVSFEDGELKLQSRGHYLRGGPREKQFELLKQWAATHEVAFYDLLGERYVMYGEWMFAAHTIFYDQLPHYFMEFDVLDKETGKFLSTPARDALLRSPKRMSHPNDYSKSWDVSVDIVPVRVIAAGVVKSVDELRGMIGQSAFINCEDHWAFCRESMEKTLAARGETYKESPECGHTFSKALCKAHGLKQSMDGYMPQEDFDRYQELSRKYYVGPTMEGLYVKWEEDGEVKGRYKFVRGDFISQIAGAEEHWHDRPILQNQLVEGGLERMFSVRQ